MSDPFDLQADLELALRATRLAGAEVLANFGTKLDVTYKSPDQPVTVADLRADALLKEILVGERPDYGWLSEETKDSPDRLSRRRVWIVDPIDGTRSFVQGRPEYVISVALAVGEHVLIGIVHNPSTGQLFHAVRGGGAHRDGERIRVASGKRSLLVSRSDLHSGEFGPLQDEWELVPLGSTAYKMVRVADGTGTAYVSRGPKSEWDVAAAALIVHEAGGVATDGQGGELRFNRPVPFLRGVVTATRGTHEALIRRIATLPDQER